MLMIAPCRYSRVDSLPPFDYMDSEEEDERGERQLNKLKNQLKDIEGRQQKLFEAVESGILEIDEHLKKRSHELKAQREALQLELASRSQRQMLPTSYLKPGQAELFGKIMRQRLLSADTPLSKSYLRRWWTKLSLRIKRPPLKEAMLPCLAR